MWNFDKYQKQDYHTISNDKNNCVAVLRNWILTNLLRSWIGTKILSKNSTKSQHNTNIQLSHWMMPVSTNVFSYSSPCRAKSPKHDLNKLLNDAKLDPTQHTSVTSCMVEFSDSPLHFHFDFPYGHGYAREGNLLTTLCTKIVNTKTWDHKSIYVNLQLDSSNNLSSLLAEPRFAVDDFRFWPLAESKTYHYQIGDQRIEIQWTSTIFR